MFRIYRTFGVIIAAFLLVNYPVFSLDLEFSSTQETVPDAFMNPENQTPLLMDSFSNEYLKSGRMVVVEAVEESLVSDSAEKPAEVTTLIIPLDPEPVEKLDVYISAGPDGYGFTGNEIYIGSDIALPDYVSIQWYQTGGPTVDVVNSSLSRTSFVPEFEGVYSFLILAQFPDGNTAADSVTVLVDDPEGNSVPAAWAGDDQYVGLNPGISSSVILQGSGYDADGDDLEFLWDQVSGAEVEITPLENGAVELVFTENGVYLFSLSVFDGNTVSIPDTVNVVCYPVDNLPPIAFAEDLRTEFDGTPQIVLLDGSESYDPDGDALSYIWEQIDGRPVTLSDEAGPIPLFTCEKKGNYLFSLTVDDGVNKSAPVTVSVEAASPADEGEGSFGCSPVKGRADTMIILVITLIVIAGRRRKREWEKQNTVLALTLEQNQDDQSL